VLIPCPCGHTVRAPDNAKARAVHCPSCGKRLRIAEPPARPHQGEEPPDFSHVRRSTGLPFRCWTYIRFYPLWPLLLTVLFLGFGALAVLVHWAFWIAFGIVALVKLYYWLVVWSYYHHGGVYPALVVADQPYRVAVLVNLALEVDDSYPAVQVVDLPLQRLPEGAPRVGDRLVTIHLVAAEDEKRRMATRLFCVPARFITSNPQDLDRLLSTIGDDEWEVLEQWVAAHQRSYQPGIHPLDTPAEEVGEESGEEDAE
jgi:Protein of unknown function (DUF3239)